MEKITPTPVLGNVHTNRQLAYQRINRVLEDLNERITPKEPTFLRQDRTIGKYAPRPKFEKDEIQQFITDNINYFRKQSLVNEAYDKLNKQVALREIYDFFYLILRKYNYSFTFEDLFGVDFSHWTRDRLSDGGKNNLQQILKLSLLIILLDSFGRGEEDYQQTQLLKQQICKRVKNLTDDIKWFYDLLSMFDCKTSELFYNIKTIEEIFSSVKQINKGISLQILDFRLAELIKANVLES